MGLGPALCVEHQVLAVMRNHKDSRCEWICPVCRTTKLGNTGLMFDDDKWQQ